MSSLLPPNLKPPKPKTILPLLLHFSSSSSSSPLLKAKLLHQKLITTTGTLSHPKIISLYLSSNSPSLALSTLLLLPPSPSSLFFYNTLLSIPSPPLPPLPIFNSMRRLSLPPDSYTYPYIIKAVSHLNSLPLGASLHCLALRDGFGGNVFVGNAVVAMYGRCGAVGDARKVFDELVGVGVGDLVSWNSIAVVYVHTGECMRALEVFELMVRRGDWGLRPDVISLINVLAACASLKRGGLGEEVHCCALRRGLIGDVFVGNALVDMYAKCGFIDMALEVFESMPRSNVVPWAAMICGLGTHGHAKRAIEFLRRMDVEENIRPDGVVLLGVLTACAHAGLHKEGHFLLNKMDALYGVIPQQEHYSCVVDMLCRAGKLDDAVNVIRRMPMKPQASVWGALLNGCRIHNNVSLAELAVKELLSLEEGNGDEEDAAYVQLSYIYLASQRSDEARRVRKMIGDKGLKKSAGGSAIEVDGEVHEFVAGESSHPHLAQIHEILKWMSGDSTIRLS